MASAATALRIQIESALAHKIPGALSPRIQHASEVIPFGIPEVDSLLQGGVPRGGITEISGAASSGRTFLALSVTAKASNAGLSCAWIDAQDRLDPESAASCGINLRQLLWVRASEPLEASPESSTANKQRSRVQRSWSRLDQVLRATDLVLQTGGFGIVVLDLADVEEKQALRIPIASWYRFRQCAEQAQTALLLLTRTACSRSCASLVLTCQTTVPQQWSSHGETALFTSKTCCVLRERQRKVESNIVSLEKSRHPQASWVTSPSWTK